MQPTNINTDNSVISEVLVAPNEMSLPLQEEMVNSLTMLRLTNILDGKKTYKGLVLNKIKERCDKLSEVIEKEIKINPNNPKIKMGIAQLRNSALFIKYLDELMEKSSHLLSNVIGYEKTADLELLEDYEDDVDILSKQANEDGNSTTNYQSELPPNVKRILFLVPKVRPLNLSVERDKATYEKTKLFYKKIQNHLGFFNPNPINDTWNKLVNYISSYYYEPTIDGFNRFLNDLKSNDAPLVVQELANILEKQTQNDKILFFTKVTLQKRNNKRLLFETKKESYYDQFSAMEVKGEKTLAKIIDPARTEGVNKVFEQLHQDFLSSTTGILIEDESTGLLRVNKELARSLGRDLDRLLKDKNSRKTTKDGLPLRFLSEEGFITFYNIVRKIGINISPAALSDLLKYYKDETIEEHHNNDISTIRVLFYNKIFGTLAASDENITELSQENPFVKEITTLKIISNYEYKYRENLSTGAVRVDTKSYYPYIRHHYLSTIFSMINSELTDKGSKSSFISGKMDFDSFARYSVYLKKLSENDRNFIKTFKMFYELGGANRNTNNENKLLKDMLPREHQIMKYMLFQNQGHNSSYFLSDTMSDKVSKPIFHAPKLDVEFIGSLKNDDLRLDENTLNLLYRYFVAEIDRINEVQKQNKELQNWQKIKGYHTLNYGTDKPKKGLGDNFLIFEFLNKEFLLTSEIDNNGEVDAQDLEIYRLLYTNDEINDYKDIISNKELKELIKNKINKRFVDIAKQHYQDAVENQLFTKVLNEKTGRYEFDLNQLLDSRYIRNKVLPNINVEIKNNAFLFQGNTSGLKENEFDAIIEYLMVDYAVNTSINHIEMLMITGDPAQGGKLSSMKDVDIEKKYSKELQISENKAVALKRFRLLENILETNTNIMKRNASFLASGETGLFENNKYKVAFANDLEINTPLINEYIALFPSNKENGIKKAFKSGDKTDAQEVTTVKEDLLVRKAYNQIDEEIYEKALFVYDREQYNKDYGNKSLTITEKDKEHIDNIIFQPQKPVQRGFKINSGLKISEQFYIKTSAFPLIPSLVKGTPLEDLLNDMKEIGVNRIAFNSGVKQGVKGSKDLFNKDNTYNKSFLENNTHELDRTWFRIQLNVPYEENKQQIREGTQPAKMLFMNIPNDIKLMYKGKETTVGEIKKEYINAHKEIADIKTKDLLDELGAVEVFDTNGDPTGSYKLSNFNKLSKIIQEEGIDRNWTLNTLKGLDIDENGQFKVPLTFFPNSGTIEPVLTAIVTNRIAKSKLPGKSYVQGSEFMLNNVKLDEDVLHEVREDIVWTKPEYANKTKLNFLSPKEKDKKNSKKRISTNYYTFLSN